MHSEQRTKHRQRIRRRKSVRHRLSKRGSLPRLSVSRSSKHIYAQVIDDEAGRTLAAAGTVGKGLRDALGGKNKTERAAAVGTEIARLASEKGIDAVVFDRGHCKYHGRVKALADAAREGGLRF